MRRLPRSSAFSIFEVLAVELRSVPGAQFHTALPRESWTMRPGGEGGGYGFRISSPEGHPLCISSDVVRHITAIDDRTRPTKLTL